MALGVKSELRVYAKGNPRPDRPDSIEYTGIRESGGSVLNAGLLNGKAFLNRAPDGIPAQAKNYIVEMDVSLFETDIPPRHMWMPENRGKYRVLWKRKLKTIS
jgi:hypothetical protein